MLTAIVPNVVQKGVSATAIPARVTLMLFTSSGETLGNIDIEPDKTRPTVLHIPEENKPICSQ